MFYANWFDVDVEEIMAAQSNDSIGVVEITVKRCRKLKTGNPTKPKVLTHTFKSKLPTMGKSMKEQKLRNWSMTQYLWRQNHFS